jgi:nucleoside-diphosphate-sugar epimerase
VNRSTRVLVAGATGVIGRRLVPLLRHEGYAVTGLTRSPARADRLRSAGAEAIVVDALDREALIGAVVAARPAVLIHQLTDLATAPGVPIGPAELERTARLRDEGTANLVAAAEAAGVRRIVAQGLSGVYADGPGPRAEDDALVPDGPDAPPTIRGIHALERHLRCTAVEGVVLRYGWLYGPGTGLEAPWAAPGLHVDAAAWAAVLAIDHGRPGPINIADDDGSVSIRRARVELVWAPELRLPTSLAGDLQP